MSSRWKPLLTRVAAVGVSLAALSACAGEAAEPLSEQLLSEQAQSEQAHSEQTKSKQTREREPADASAPADAPAPGDTSLPPGDPGLDAPSVPDPGTAPVKAHGEKGEEHVRRTVPGGAMLTAEDVSTVAGAEWAQRDGGGDECVRLDEHVATRSRSFGASGSGVFVETVATYPDARRADAAVTRLAGAARRCGWGSIEDPRLGSAAVRAVADGRSLTAVSAEGVVVLMVGSGPVTQGWTWDGLVDMALGSSCPAAPDGCH